MIERFEKFSIAISEISKHWHKLTAEEMEKYGLKGNHSMYLLTMAKHPEGLTAPRLGELCGRDKADVSRMMSIMEQKRLVTKQGTHQNQYGGVFKLTEKGREAAAFVRQKANRAVEFAGKELSEESRENFYDALESIISNLRLLSKEGIPE